MNFLKHCRQLKIQRARSTSTEAAQKKRDVIPYRGTPTTTGIVRVTLLPGHGVGPIITEALERIFRAASVPVEWDVIFFRPDDEARMREVIRSVKKNRVALYGPHKWPSPESRIKTNIFQRNELKLFADVRHARSLPSNASPKLGGRDMDVIMIREVSEGSFFGIEHRVQPDIVQCIGLVTQAASERIAQLAFHLAKLHGRKRLTALHKLNIMRLSDKLWLDCVRRVSQDSAHQEILYKEEYIQNAITQLILEPSVFDVIVSTNLYGDILTDLCTALAGNLSLCARAAYGEEGVGIFSPAHGPAENIHPQQNVNPIAFIRAGVMMLVHIGMFQKAQLIEECSMSVMKEGEVATRDLGGTATCYQFADAICKKIRLRDPDVISTNVSTSVKSGSQ